MEDIKVTNAADMNFDFGIGVVNKKAVFPTKPKDVKKGYGQFKAYQMVTYVDGKSDLEEITLAPCNDVNDTFKLVPQRHEL